MLTLNLNPLPPEAVVKTVMAEEGDVEVITWYEGTKALSMAGNRFLSTQIVNPLLGKVKICLYSLFGWDFRRSVSEVPNRYLASPKQRIENVYAAAFFQFCLSITDGPLYRAIQEALPKKQWLFDLSKDRKNYGKKVALFFEGRPSLLNCLYQLKTGYAYSAMQYVEGYFLIREAVRKALDARKTTLNVFFVLPNDEGKYYKDLPAEIDNLLKLDFGDQLKTLAVKVTFLPYSYGKTLAARPYNQ